MQDAIILTGKEKEAFLKLNKEGYLEELKKSETFCLELNNKIMFIEEYTPAFRSIVKSEGIEITRLDLNEKLKQAIDLKIKKLDMADKLLFKAKNYNKRYKQKIRKSFARKILKWLKII